MRFAGCVGTVVPPLVVIPATITDWAEEIRHLLSRELFRRRRHVTLILTLLTVTAGAVQDGENA